MTGGGGEGESDGRGEEERGEEMREEERRSFRGRSTHLAPIAPSLVLNESPAHSRGQQTLFIYLFIYFQLACFLFPSRQSIWLMLSLHCLLKHNLAHTSHPDVPGLSQNNQACFIPITSENLKLHRTAVLHTVKDMND